MQTDYLNYIYIKCIMYIIVYTINVLLKVKITTYMCQLENKHTIVIY